MRTKPWLGKVLAVFMHPNMREALDMLVYIQTRANEVAAITGCTAEAVSDTIYKLAFETLHTGQSAADHVRDYAMSTGELLELKE